MNVSKMKRDGNEKDKGVCEEASVLLFVNSEVTHTGYVSSGGHTST